MVDKTKVSGRSAVSGLAINFGLVTITGNCYKPIDVDKTTSLKVVCPECTTPLTQKYHCENGHGPYLPADTAKAKEMDDKSLVPMTPEQVAEAKGSTLVERKFELRIHPREEVEAKLVNGEASYVFYPQSSSEMSFAILRDLIEAHPEYVFLGMTVLRQGGGDKLMRLELGMNGQLLMQEVAWFTDVKEFPAATFDYTPKMYALAENLIESLVEEFDPTEYEPAARARMAKAIADASNGTVTVSAATKVTASATSLEDMLEAALSAAKPKKKPAAKRQTRKAS